MKMELRVNPVKIEANSDGSMTVSGYVNKTEQFSELLGRTERFKEKISKGAFERAITKAKEIHFLAEHDNGKILASTRNGSLTLTEDEQGLHMSAAICPTSWGKDYFQLIDSGILQNMSFGFRAVKDAWKKTMEGYFERTVSELELFEVSVVRDPAYSQSTISARGIDLVEDVEIPAEAVNEVNIKVDEFAVRSAEDIQAIADKLFEMLSQKFAEQQATPQEPESEPNDESTEDPVEEAQESPLEEAVEEVIEEAVEEAIEEVVQPDVVDENSEVDEVVEPETEPIYKGGTVDAQKIRDFIQKFKQV